MTTVLLSSENHQDVRVDTRASAEFGDLINRVDLLCSEFNEAHKEFPILLQQDADTGRISAQAILGFEQDENLYVDDDAWLSSYIPANIARGPFSLAYEHDEEDETRVTDVKVQIDESSPRLGDAGQAIFLELGGESPYLESVRNVLLLIDSGVRGDAVFYPLLLEMDLLEQVNITISIDEGTQYEFSDYLTIDQQKLATLTEEQLTKLNQSGALGLVFFLVSSIGNFQRLIRAQQARSQRGNG